MKKTKLLTSIAALALVASLGACTTGDIIIDVGGVDLDVDVDSTESTETSDSTETGGLSDSTETGGSSDSTETGGTSDSTESGSGDTSTPTPEPDPEPDPEPEPETDYWSNHLTQAQLNSAKELLGCDIDDVLPYVLPDGLELQCSVNSRYVSIEEYSVTQYIDGVQETWIEALTAFGYEQSGSSYYYNDYRVAMQDSSAPASNFTDVAVNLYPPEKQEETKIDSWAKLLTTADYQNFAAVFGKEIESVLPFYAPNESAELGGYTSASLSTSAATLTLTATPTSSGQSSAELDNNWGYVLGQFGYSATHNGSQTTYVLNGFQVVTNYDSSSFSFVFSKYEEPQNPDEDIAEAILDNILGQTPNWEAFYGYAEDDWGGSITEYLTTDSDSNLYGYKDCDDFDDDTYTYYYYGGYRCMYSYSGHQAQTPQVVYTTYEDELEFFATGLNETFDLSDSSHFELNETSNGYKLTVLLAPYYVALESYTFTVDASYNLLAIDRDTEIGSHSDEIATSHVEGITYAEVEEALAETGFNPEDFGLGEKEEDDGLAHNPAELMEKIYNENNYHITLYYDAYETDEDYRITYGDYLSNSTYYWYYLQTYVDVEYYAYDIYYMEDALLVDEYKYNGYYYAATGYEVIFYDYGEGNSVYRWTTSNGYQFSGSYWNAQYRLYDIVYSMMLAYSYYGVQNGFSYTGSGTDYYGDEYDSYNLNSTSALYLFTCLGTEFLFGTQSACINAAYSFDFDGAYFYEESQSMEVDYWTYGLYTDDSTATSDSIVYFGEYIIEAVIDDVGTTTDYGYCQYMSNYFLGI